MHRAVKSYITVRAFHTIFHAFPYGALFLALLLTFYMRLRSLRLRRNSHVL